jgi:hypothetical protein
MPMPATAQINPYPDIAPPADATTVDDWQDIDPQPYRVVLGADRTVTDHPLTVSPSGVQFADGSIECPSVYIIDGENWLSPLNSDQARELAAVLLEAAAELDGWAAA